MTDLEKRAREFAEHHHAAVGQVRKYTEACGGFAGALRIQD